MANEAKGDLLSLEMLPAIIAEYGWRVGNYLKK